MPKLTKLDQALDVIADLFADIVEGKANNMGEEYGTPPRNKQAWAQRDILQAIAWKANSALDRQGGADMRMADVRKRAAEVAATPATEIDMNEAQRVAADAEFWGFQQHALEQLMKAASEALVRHGHEKYVRQDMTKRRTISADNPQKDQAALAAAFSSLGVTLPEREE